MAIASLADPETLRPETLLVREHKYGGIQYTLGCLPAHPQRVQSKVVAAMPIRKRVGIANPYRLNRLVSIKRGGRDRQPKE